MNNIIQSLGSHFKALLPSVCLLSAFSAYADNKAYVEDFSIGAGETKQVTVVLDNDDVMSSVIIDVTLPEGLKIVDGTAKKETTRLRDQDQALSIDNPDKDQTWRITILERNNNTIAGNSGAVCYFSVTADNTFAVDAQITATGNGSVWDSANGKALSYDLGETTSKVQCMSYSLTSPSKLMLRSGDTGTVEVALNNVDGIAGLQADIEMPEGLSVVDGSFKLIGKAVSDGLSFGIVANETNTKVILSTMEPQKPIPASSDNQLVFSFDVLAGENVQESSEIILSNVVLSKPDMTKVYPSALSIIVTSQDAHIIPSLPASVEMFPGETKAIPFMLDNDVELCAMQGVITLPEGLSFVTNESGNYLGYGERIPESANFGLPENITEDTRTLRFTLSSLDNASFIGTSGELFTINVKASESWSAENGIVTVSELVASNSSMKKFSLTQVASTLVENTKASIEDRVNGITSSNTILQDVVELASGESKEIAFNLNTDIALTNLNVTLDIPEGLTLESLSENASMKLVDGKTVVIVESVAANAITPVFTIKVKAGDKVADSTIAFSNVKATVAGSEYVLPSSEVNVVKKTLQGLYGDVNGDGKVDATDKTIITQIIKNAK